jgi:hypothetical protein
MGNATQEDIDQARALFLDHLPEDVRADVIAAREQARNEPSDLILPAQCIGSAEVVDGVIDIGGVKIELGRPGWNPRQDDMGKWIGHLPVYVRRLQNEGSVFEIHLAFGDGLQMEESEWLERQEDEHPGGPKGFWRDRVVKGDDELLTDEEFEKFWHNQPFGWVEGYSEKHGKIVRYHDPDEEVTDGFDPDDVQDEANYPTIASVTVPAGEYFLGDPGYAAGDYPDNGWDILVNQWFPREGPDGGPIAKLPDGTEVLAFSTALGDGLYSDDQANTYPVNGGCIGLVPVTEVTTKLVEDEEAESSYDQIVTRVRFEEPTRCYIKGKIDGPIMSGDRKAVLVFGDHRIWT